MLEVAVTLLIVGCVMGVCEAWTWKRRAREWQRTAKVTATLAEQIIELHAPDDDELLEARAELRRIKGGVPS